MISEAHLETYHITLTTKAPVFVGSGAVIKKSEYCYFPNMQKAYILDRDKFFAFLVDNNLLEKYEEFIFISGSDLVWFLNRCGYNHKHVSEFTLYSADVGDALDESRSIKDIHCFMRNNKGQAYIPGSSLKGVLRTVLLTKMIADKKYPDYFDIKDKRAADRIERYYFNQLNLNFKKKEDMVNDIMRSVSISDSEIIADSDFTLCAKYDISPKGNKKRINVVRECVKPGVEIRFALTIDKSYGKYISVDDIRAAISAFSAYYAKEYMPYFTSSNVLRPEHNTIFLGGGSGYFSKNIVYPLLGHAKAVGEVSGFMKGKFSSHNHENDANQGISPRMLKCTTYRRGEYQFGLCHIDIN